MFFQILLFGGFRKLSRPQKREIFGRERGLRYLKSHPQFKEVLHLFISAE